MKNFFPFFKEHFNIAYFDSAATTLKSQQVIDSIAHAYTKYTLPIGKSIYKEAENYYEDMVIPLKLKIQLLFQAKEYEIFFGHSVTILLSQLLELILLTLLKKNQKIKILMPETAHNSFLLGIQKYKNIKLYSYNRYNIKLFLDLHKFDIIYIATIDHITGEEINYNDVIEYKKITLL